MRPGIGHRCHYPPLFQYYRSTVHYPYHVGIVFVGRRATIVRDPFSHNYPLYLDTLCNSPIATVAAGILIEIFGSVGPFTR